MVQFLCHLTHSFCHDRIWRIRPLILLGLLGGFYEGFCHSGDLLAGIAEHHGHLLKLGFRGRCLEGGLLKLFGQVVDLALCILAAADFDAPEPAGRPRPTYSSVAVFMLVPPGLERALGACAVRLRLRCGGHGPGLTAVMVCFAFAMSIETEVILRGSTLDSPIKALALCALFGLALSHPLANASEAMRDRAVAA